MAPETAGTGLAPRWCGTMESTGTCSAAGAGRTVSARSGGHAWRCPTVGAPQLRRERTKDMEEMNRMDSKAEEFATLCKETFRPYPMKSGKHFMSSRKVHRMCHGGTQSHRLQFWATA